MSELSALHERLLSVVGETTYKSLANQTAHSPETVPRYMQGQAPSVEFLAQVCALFDVNANWLLTGAGASRGSDERVEALRRSSPAELLSAIADGLETLAARVDRLERFVQRTETRFNALETELRDERIETRASGDAEANGSQEPGGATGRARTIARAVPERSLENADRTAQAGDP